MLESSGQCRACQATLRSGTQFCPACGQPLSASTPAPARTERRGSGAAQFADHLRELKRIGWLFGLLLAGSFVLGMVSRSDSSPWPLVVLSTVDAAIVLVAVCLRYQRLLFLFDVHPVGLRRSLELIAASLAFMGAMSVYFWVLQQLGVPLSSATATFALAGWPVWTMMLLISFMPAVFEELAFRGVIQSSLERVFNARDAWLIQAALFSVLHLTPLAFPSHFVMGLWLGHLRMRTRSVYPGMLLHAVWNALVVFEEISSR